MWFRSNSPHLPWVVVSAAESSQLVNIAVDISELIPSSNGTHESWLDRCLALLFLQVTKVGWIIDVVCANLAALLDKLKRSLIVNLPKGVRTLGLCVDWLGEILAYVCVIIHLLYGSGGLGETDVSALGVLNGGHLGVAGVRTHHSSCIMLWNASVLGCWSKLSVSWLQLLAFLVIIQILVLDLHIRYNGIVVSLKKADVATSTTHSENLLDRHTRSFFRLLSVRWLCLSRLVWLVKRSIKLIDINCLSTIVTWYRHVVIPTVWFGVGQRRSCPWVEDQVRISKDLLVIDKVTDLCGDWVVTLWCQLGLALWWLSSQVLVIYVLV